MQTQQQFGFTVAEVLVALAVLALGMLGAGAMQLAATRARQETRWQSAAWQLAAGMAGSVRANPGQLESIYLTLDYDAAGSAGGAPPSVAPCNPCDGAALAQSDLETLKYQLARQLPAGRARICRDTHPWAGGRLRWACSGAGAVVVKIGWRGRLPNGKPDHEAPAVALVVAGVRPGVLP